MRDLGPRKWDGFKRQRLTGALIEDQRSLINRITFVLPGYPRLIGGFRVVYEYANQLAVRAYIVTIVHSWYLPNFDCPRNLYRSLCRKTGNLLTRSSKPKLRWLPIDSQIKMLYAREPLPNCKPNGDVVFATAWQTAEYVADYPASKGLKFYLVQDFQSYFGPQDRLEATWTLPFKKITVSHWLYRQVASVAGTQELVSISNGIATDRFQMIGDVDFRPVGLTMMYSPATYKAGEGK